MNALMRSAWVLGGCVALGTGAANADDGGVTTAKHFLGTQTIQASVSNYNTTYSSVYHSILWGLITWTSSVCSQTCMTATQTTTAPIYNVTTTQYCSALDPADDFIHVIGILGTGDADGTSLVSALDAFISLESGTSIVIDVLGQTGDPFTMTGDELTLGRGDDLSAILPVGFDDSLFVSLDAGAGRDWLYYSYNIPVSRMVMVPGPSGVATLAACVLLAWRRRR